MACGKEKKAKTITAPAAPTPKVAPAPQQAAPSVVQTGKEFDGVVYAELRRSERFKHIFSVALIRVNMSLWLDKRAERREKIRDLVRRV